MVALDKADALATQRATTLARAEELGAAVACAAADAGVLHKHVELLRCRARELNAQLSMEKQSGGAHLGSLRERLAEYRTHLAGGAA